MEKFNVLSIAVITMNRATKLKEALESCLKCNLPHSTQFVIVDNASTDNTKEIVESIINQNPNFKFDYFCSSENLGVGNGRNKAFEMSNGRYVYFLDDDAYIDPRCYNSFFIDCISIMDRNLSIASLSTKVHDNILGDSRNPKCEKGKNELVDVLTWAGCSHFLRKSSFEKTLYFNIRYGCEELAPGIFMWNKHLRNVYYDSVQIIHNPLVDKWNKNNSQSKNIIELHASMHFATFKLIYPTIFYPIIFLSLLVRCLKYGSSLFNCLNQAHTLIKDSGRISKVSIWTVFRLWYKFGLSIF